jgi:DNA replication protein DnaC
MNTDLEKLFKEYRMQGLLKNMGNIISNKDLLSSAKLFMEWEKIERTEKKLNLAMQKTGLKKYGQFDSIQEFDWNWPKTIDKNLVLELFNLDFIKEKTNVVLLGSSGVGKTMIAKNLVHVAACSGYHSHFVETADLLDDLVSEEKNGYIRVKLDYYTKPDLLAIDEVGYLSYNSRHADLLFQLFNKRTADKATIITTNHSFSEWGGLFPNAASVNALIDRLIERCELIQIEADTYRGKKFTDRKEKKLKLHQEFKK